MRDPAFRSLMLLVNLLLLLNYSGVPNGSFGDDDAQSR